MKRTPLYILPQTTTQTSPVAMRRHSVFVLTLFLAATLAQPAEAQLSRHRYGTFEENKGQFAEEVRYVARMPHVDIWITNNELVYDVFRLDPDEKAIAEKRTRFGEEYETHRPDEPEPQLRSGQAIFVSYKGGTAAPIFEAHKPVSGVFNYLSGGEGAGDVTGVERFSELYVRNVYTGIDARYYFDRGGFRYDFVVHPGADPRTIRMGFEGAEVELTSNGELGLETVAGTLVHGDLQTFSGKGRNKRSVLSTFRVNGNEVGFAVGVYDSSAALVIDPWVFGTFFGGRGSDGIVEMHVFDNMEILVLVASGNSSECQCEFNLPVTPGAYISQPGQNGLALIRLTADASDLVFGTYLTAQPGCLGEEASIAVDDSGIYLATMTKSLYLLPGDPMCDYPVSDGAYDRTDNGKEDIVLMKLSTDGRSQLWATGFGGSEGEFVRDLAVDDQGHPVIAGKSRSPDLPVSPGAYLSGADLDFSGTGLAYNFIARFDALGQHLEMSTFLGTHSLHDFDIDLAANGVIYATGTDNNGLLTTDDQSLDSDPGTGGEAFLFVLSADGTTREYSTFLGEDDSERGKCIKRDPAGNIFIVGTSNASEDFLPDARIYGNPFGIGWSNRREHNPFIVKLDPAGRQILESVRMGNPEGSGPHDCTIKDGYLAFTGSVGPHTTAYPTTPDAAPCDPTGDGVVVSIFDTEKLILRHSSVVGGSWPREEGFAIYADRHGWIVSGITTSWNFPRTPGTQNSDMYSDGEFPEAFVLRYEYPYPLFLPADPSVAPEVGRVAFFPNPASTKITVTFPLQNSGIVRIELFQIDGRKAGELYAGWLPAGEPAIVLSLPSGVASGVYVLRVRLSENTEYSLPIVVYKR